MFFFKKGKTEMSHWHKYSDHLVSTWLKHLFQWFQHWVFLGVTRQAYGDFLLFFSVDPLKLCQVRWGPSVNRHFQVSPEMFDLGSGLWLTHSRTFTALSLSHTCYVLALCFHDAATTVLHLGTVLGRWWVVPGFLQTWFWGHSMQQNLFL